MSNSTFENVNLLPHDHPEMQPGVAIPGETAFSIMFVSVGMSCFIWQSMTAGWMFYKARKPVIGIVFFQAVLGVVVTFVTLLTSLIEIDCTFRLLFSVLGVNIGDISLQFVLLWKAYLGNNRSKVILVVGSIPILAIAVFICVNMTFGKSKTFTGVGLCTTEYPLYIVITKAAIDCSANTFLSGCFLLVIYRHYRILGSSIQKTLITEGLIYCFGVCFSNILTGILLTKNVIGGSTPILYTIDWYLASYLIIKQLRQRNIPIKKEENEENEEDAKTIKSLESLDERKDPEELRDHKNDITNNDLSQDSREYYRDTFYSSMDGTLIVPCSPTPDFPSYDDDDGEDNRTRCSRLPSLPVYIEQQKFTVSPASTPDVGSNVEEDLITQLSVHNPSMKNKSDI
ncbi:unnamed protein product [Mucor hiemalis]